MYLFDASSIIHAWDNYPIDNFPPLWDWIAKEFNENKFMISKIAYDPEIKKNSPDCANWLKKAGMARLEISNNILQIASAIKKLLDIKDDSYYAGGVNENDILIIATAKAHKLTLISEERRQPKLPDKTQNYKIPAVCNLADVQVKCIPFIDLIKKSKAKFI